MDPATLGADLSAFGTQLAAWAATALPNFVMGLVLLVGGWWLSAWAHRTLARVLEPRVDPMLRGILGTLARYAILIVTLVAALGQLGVQTTSVLAALGAAGLAIGLALQGTLANVAAGMMLLWLRPFKVGDYIEAGSVAGTLKEIGLFASEIHTWDGIFQFVPNAELWNKRLINYSRLPTRLVNLQYRIAYKDPIAKGRDVLMAVATADGRVLRDPAPFTFVADIGDSAVVLELRVWVRTADYWDVRRALTEQGKLALEEAGLTIPFPQRDVHYRGAPTGPHRPAVELAS